MKLLRYRGVFYEYTQPLKKEVLGRQIEQLNVINWRFAMYIQLVGSLWKLYHLGWTNGSLKYLSPLQHSLLSIFLLYRKGFVEGSQWRQEQMGS